MLEQQKWHLKAKGRGPLQGKGRVHSRPHEIHHAKLSAFF